MIVIGIDCATDDAKVGVALADCDGTQMALRQAQLCSRERSVVDIVAGWLRNPDEAALLAIDAPLGWPEPLARALSGHRAGGELHVKPNEMFRRTSDRFIQAEVSKTPLDVGADRIARTAHAALALLAGLRARIGVPIPLAWSSTFTGIAAIEVYPAATLVAHGFRSSGYKKPVQVAERRALVASIGEEIDIRGHKTVLESSADALDAAVCVLAGDESGNVIGERASDRHWPSRKPGGPAATSSHPWSGTRDHGRQVLH